MGYSQCNDNLGVSKVSFWDKVALLNLKCWWRNYHTRKQLKHLPKHLLEDIGVTQQQAQEESHRHFWDK